MGSFVKLFLHRLAMPWPAIAMTLAFACAHASASLAAEPPPVVGIVVMQGWSSCEDVTDAGSSVWPYIESLTNDLIRVAGTRPAVLVSCFGIDTSRLDLRFREGRHGRIERVIDLNSFAQRVGQVASRLHIISHSHGSWLAMRTIATLQRTDRSHPEIATLATIDPISYILCTPRELARHMFGILSGMRDHPGCQSTTPDLRSIFGVVRDRVGIWANLYQTQYEAVHASYVSEATHNEIFGYRYNRFDSRPHTEIKTDPRVWERIREMILDAH